MSVVHILGTGCPKCLKLTENVNQAIERACLQGVTVQKVTDIKEIMKFGVMMTPALVVDGEIKVMGRVTGVDELVALLSAGS